MNWPGPKYLYAGNGIPFWELKDPGVVYVLQSKEVWIWPAFRVGFQFRIEGMVLTTVSDKPRVFVVDELIEESVCDDMVAKHAKDLHPSPEKHYSDEYKDHRTSETGWLNGHSELRFKMQRILRYPIVEYVEQLQFLKYTKGQWYKHHHDYFHTYQVLWFRETVRRTKSVVASLCENDPERFVKSHPTVSTAAQALQTLLGRSTPLNNVRFPKSSMLDSNKYPILSFILNEAFDRETRNMPKLLLASACDAIGVTAYCSYRKLELTAIKQSRTLQFEDFISKVAIALSVAVAQALGKELGLPREATKAFIYKQYPELDELQVEKWTLAIDIQFNRHATILPYLSNVKEGGETVLPNALHPELFLGLNFTYPVHEGMPECSRGLVLSPKKGSAALFYHRLPNGQLDILSLHGGCPPKQGIKYAVNGFTWNTPSTNGFTYVDF